MPMMTLPEREALLAILTSGTRTEIQFQLASTVIELMDRIQQLEDCLDRMTGVPPDALHNATDFYAPANASELDNTSSVVLEDGATEVRPFHGFDIANEKPGNVNLDEIPVSSDTVQQVLKSISDVS